MGSAQQKQLAALTARPAIMFESQGDDGKPFVPPTEFRLFAAGTNHTDKGDFLFDDVAAEAVMAIYRQKGVPLMGDYEHQTLADPPIEAPASIKEFVPAIRRDAFDGPELWATAVKWTDRARAYLEAREYRMFSPAFRFESENGRITQLINVALTNNPATHGQEPLVAATAATERTDTMACETCGRTEAKMSAMADEHRAHLKAQMDEHEKKIGELTAKLKSFEDWATEEAQEHEGESKSTLTALSSFRKSVCALTGQKSLTGSVGVLQALKQSHEELAKLKAELATTKAAGLSAEFTATLGAAVKDGKVSPAEKAIYEEQAKTMGTEACLTMLKAFVGARGQVVSLSSTLPASDGGSPLSPVLAEISAHMGTSNLNIPFNKRVAELVAQKTRA